MRPAPHPGFTSGRMTQRIMIALRVALTAVLAASLAYGIGKLAA